MKPLLYLITRCARAPLRSHDDVVQALEPVPTKRVPPEVDVEPKPADL